MWQRIRSPEGRMFGGDEGGIFRSSDGGSTWTKLANGLPETNIGRIGLSMAPSRPNIIYALYADEVGPFRGLFKSTDGGESWSRLPDHSLIVGNYVSYGWWFGNLRVHPESPDTVFALGLELLKTVDGGTTWAHTSSQMHVDHHGLYIHPQDPNLIVSGNDGGLYVSTNGGTDWDHRDNLPVTQFYTVEIDHQNPLHVAGGTQDNNTYHTTTSMPAEWEALFAVGDGQYVGIDPDDNRTIYGSYQRGNLLRSLDGGNTFTRVLNGINRQEPVNWSAPIELDPSSPETLYTGTDRVYGSEDKATTWQPISPRLPQSGGTGSIFDTFGTITTIAVAPTHANYIYAGTDDGLVWVSTDGGTTWDDVSQSLPKRWVTRITVDPRFETTAYVSFSGFREDSPLSHVFKTIDAGQSWTAIAGNLPEAPVNDIIPDPVQPGLLYVATDVGVYYSIDDGLTWMALGEGLPRVVINDLSLHASSRLLVAATYGRSLFSFDLTNIDIGPISVEPAVPNLSEQLLSVENYPNPFSSSTRIRLSLRTASDVTVDIYDVTNRKIITLQKKNFSPGVHEVIWDGRNMQGKNVGAGRYFCRS